MGLRSKGVVYAMAGDGVKNELVMWRDYAAGESVGWVEYRGSRNDGGGTCEKPGDTPLREVSGGGRHGKRL